MLKSLLLGCLTALFSINNLYSYSFDRYLNTPHFVFHYSEIDNDTLACYAEELEGFYKEMRDEFSFSIQHPLHVNIYANIDSFHEALGLTEAPAWCVAYANSDKIDIVSPSNPGPAHSKQSINRIMKLNIVKAILYNKFGSDSPYWLIYGIAAIKANNDFSSALKYIPSLKELENSKLNGFDNIDGFNASCKFVKFIEKTFSKEALIDLLSNYEAQKEELYQSWLDSLHL